MDNGFSHAAFNLNNFQDPRQAMSSQMTKQKSKKPWWTSLISEAGGTGGAVGGAAAGAALGSVVPGLGTVVGGLAGAALGGFLGGTGGRVVENEVRDNRVGIGDALKEGALNGVLSVGPGSAFKLAKGGTAALTGGAKAFAESTAGKLPEDLLKTSTRGKLYDKGTALLGSQYGTISKPVARQTDALDTISKLADYGITKPQDAERIAQGFTGANGITNQAVLGAVGAADKVNLSHVGGAIDKALGANGVVGTHAKSVKAFVEGQIARAEDPSKVDPKMALDIMRNIEGQTAEVLGKGGTYHLATTNNVLQSKALRDIHQTVGDALYETAGANKNVANVLTPGFRDSLMKLNPGNAKWQKFVDDKVMQSKSVADLRSTMAPFVRISKIIDEGDTNALTFGGRVSNPLAGGSIGGALLGLGIKGVKNPAANAGGKALRAGATAGISPLAAPGVKGIASRMLAANANPTALLGGAAAAASPAMGQDPNTLLAAPGGDVTSSLLGQTNGQGDATSQLLGQPQQPQQQGGPSLASLQQAIQQDIQATGGKNISNLLQLAQTYGIVDSSGNPIDPNAPKSLNVGTPTAPQYGLVQSGLSGLSQLSQLIQSNPDIINRNATPGQSIPLIGSLVTNAAGAGSYHALADNIIGDLLHLQTGATATKEEIAQNRGQLPQPGDSLELRQRKLANLVANFQAFSGGNIPMTGDLLSQMNGVR